MPKNLDSNFESDIYSELSNYEMDSDAEELSSAIEKLSCKKQSFSPKDIKSKNYSQRNIFKELYKRITRKFNNYF